ncbi:large ribosomal subunit protein uL4-like [Dysidea avara]|uniref:large ribosomal subunit protein uL4-like n=1 Tax=Dysidea avara TaxID=196820 RepID=UPI003327729C
MSWCMSRHVRTFCNGFQLLSRSVNSGVLTYEYPPIPEEERKGLKDFVIDDNWVPYQLEPKQAWVTNFLTGERLGIVPLNPLVFGERHRLDTIHQVVCWERAKARSGNASTKTRAEVRGGGRKLRRQKGSGLARVGGSRAPTRVGGGVSHGPKPRSYYYPLPNQVRSLGLRAALSVKYTQGDLHIVDALNSSSQDPDELSDRLYKHGWDSVLLVDGGEIDANLYEATSDLEWCEIVPSGECEVYKVMLYSSLVLSLGAVRLIEQALAPNTPLNKSIHCDNELLQF